MRAAEIYEELCKIAPLHLQMDMDNSGFKLGDKEQAVTKVLVSLDMTAAVIDESEALGAELIVTHHPLIFSSMKDMTAGHSAQADLAVRLIRKGISTIGMHTNFDIVEGGVSDLLAQALGLENSQVLDSKNGLGRQGMLVKEYSFTSFLSHVKNTLNANGLRYAKASDNVRKVALCGGAGSDLLKDAIAAGCDTFVTAEIKHHEFLEAAHFGLNIIDAGHFPTEDVGCIFLASHLAAHFPELTVKKASSCTEIEQFYCGG